MQHRIKKAVLGDKAVEDLGRTKILVVGAGGTGSQLLKNLSKLAVGHITVLDYDSIEETNLNRQFYYRKQHIGQAKVDVVAKSLQLIDPSIDITPLSISTQHQSCNTLFLRKFDIICSCLDSQKARRGLAEQATKAGVVLIDTGTMSYFGQTYATKRFETSCHNCTPSRPEVMLPTCTIRSRPENPLHCATYAKNVYESFFGNGDTLTQNLTFSKYFENNQKPEDEILQKTAVAIFDQLFNKGVHDVDLQGHPIDHVKKLPYEYALNMQETVHNPKSTFKSQQHQKQQKSQFKEDKLCSIAQYTTTFIQKTQTLVIRRLKQSLPVVFEKDDEDVMTWIVCLANLRTYNYMNENWIHNKHKFMTYYQLKDLIGKVQPAIASANAIGAALQARQIVNLSRSIFDSLYISFSNLDDEKLRPAFQSEPNPECSVCSAKVIYACVELDWQKTTMQEFQDFTAENLFSMRRDVSCGPCMIINNGSKQPSPNKVKPIAFIKEMAKNGVLELSLMPQLKGSPIQVHISLIHKQGTKGIILQGKQSKEQRGDRLMQYYRKIRQAWADNRHYDVEYFGGHQL